jgi:predicted PurR-regulated permease PerM
VNIFELVSGSISMLVIVPLGYIAVQSMRESRDLRRIQEELTVLVRESKEISQDVQRLQRELRTEQDAARVGIDETQRTVEHVTAIVERTAEQVTDVASDTLALAVASPGAATAVTPVEQQATRSRRARHLVRLQRRVK